MTDDQGEMMRRRIVAANWKMNMTSDEAGAFINTIREGINGKEAEVHIIPPFVDIAVVQVSANIIGWTCLSELINRRCNKKAHE